MNAVEQTCSGLYAADAFALAKRKAKYGHRPWIVWQERNGEWQAEQATVETLKHAMLAVGTKGHFVGYTGHGTHAMRMSWQLALVWWRNAKCGNLFA